MSILRSEDLFVFQGCSVFGHRDCGYCHSKKPSPLALDSLTEVATNDYPLSTTIGMSLLTISCERYERFLNLGYRRSGQFLYKTDPLRGCCRMYPIRTNRDKLKLNKEHRHNINRFAKRVLQTTTDSKRLLDSLVEAESSSTRFRTVFTPAKSSKEKFALYKKYQTTVHNDKPEELSEKSFVRFLCTSVFRNENIDYSLLNGWRSRSPDELRHIKGAVHECYYMDDKLIAIAVLDILPQSVSSVYFIWDPDFASLGLGTLSALRETTLTHRLGKQWYLMGYYIGDCQKMRYKAKFGGDIWDQGSGYWFPLSLVAEQVNTGKLCVFAESGQSREPWLDPKAEVCDDDKVVNVAESVYGPKSEAYRVAKLHCYDDDEATDFEILQGEHDTYQSFHLPRVTPGLVPLWQLEKLNHSIDLSWCSTDIHDPRTRPFAECDPATQKEILDFIRLFGISELKYVFFV